MQKSLTRAHFDWPMFVFKAVSSSSHTTAADGAALGGTVGRDGVGECVGECVGDGVGEEVGAA